MISSCPTSPIRSNTWNYTNTLTTWNSLPLPHARGRRRRGDRTRSMKRKGGRTDGRTEGPFDIDLRGGGVYKGMHAFEVRRGRRRRRRRLYAHSLVLTHTTQRSIIEIGSRVCMHSTRTGRSGKTVCTESLSNSLASRENSLYARPGLASGTATLSPSVRPSVPQRARLVAAK